MDLNGLCRVLRRNVLRIEVLHFNLAASLSQVNDHLLKLAVACHTEMRVLGEEHLYQWAIRIIEPFKLDNLGLFVKLIVAKHGKRLDSDRMPSGEVDQISCVFHPTLFFDPVFRRVMLLAFDITFLVDDNISKSRSVGYP